MRENIREIDIDKRKREQRRKARAGIGRAVSQPGPDTCLLVGFPLVSLYQWDAILAVDSGWATDPLQQSRMTRAQLKGEAKE